MTWVDRHGVSSIEYKCGFCSREIASTDGWTSSPNALNNRMNIRICPNCDKTTFFDFDGNQIPSPMFGNDIEHLPKDINALYNEARACMKVQGYTSTVMDCRKLLMHIAVNCGADTKDLSFQGCVDYLKEHHYTPPGSDEWVDHIRTQGNEANHEIVLKTKEDASDLITFSEMLLKFIYEFPTKMKKKKEK